MSKPHRKQNRRPAHPVPMPSPEAEAPIERTPAAPTPLDERPRDSRIPDLFFIVGIILLAFLPGISLLTDRLIYTHETISPIVRLASVYRFLGDGQILVRWVPDYSFGYGRPLFNFYPPLFYYTACAVAYSGISLVTSFNVTCIFLWIVSGLTMYVFAKEFFGKYGGFVAAITYVYAPYHIVDLYVRGAVAEFTAFPLFPLILWSFYKQSKKPDLFYLVSGAASLGLLLLSHNIMALIFTPVAFAYIFFLYVTESKNEIQALRSNLISFVLGIALAAFFWLPAMIEKKYVNVDYMITGYYEYQKHFVYLRQLWYSKWDYGLSVEGIKDSMPYLIGFVHIVLATASLVLIGKFFKRSKTAGAQVLFMLAVGLGAALFTTSFSSPLWKLFPLLKFVQFPWRFLSVVIFALSFVSGGVLFLIKNNNLKKAALAVITLATVVTNIFYCKPDSYYDKTSHEASLHVTTKNNREFMTPFTFFGDYLPNWLKVLPYPPAPQQLTVVKGDSSITSAQHRAIEHHFNVQANTDSVLRFHTCYFPGWKVLIDGVKTDIDPVSAGGLMDFAVTKGEHHIQIQFGPTPLRFWATRISLFSLFILTLLLIAKGAALKRSPPDVPWAQNATKESGPCLTRAPVGSAAWLPPACLFLMPMIVYLKTLCPSVNGGRSGEIISAVATFSQPMGVPLYMLTGKLFSLILPFGDTAFKLNVFSAFCAALTVMIVYFILKRSTNNVPISFLSALTLGFSSMFWSQAVVATEHTLTGLLVALFIYALVLWLSDPKDKYLYLLSVFLGLGLGTQPALLLTVPAAVALLTIGSKTWLRPAAFKALALTIAAAVIPYLCIPLKAPSEPLGFGDLAHFITGGEYLSPLSAASLSGFLKIFFTSIRLLIFDFTPLGFIVILAGILASGKKSRAFLSVLSLMVIGNVVLTASYANEDILPNLSFYLFPSSIVLAVWVGYGLCAIHTYVYSREQRHLQNTLFSYAVLAVLPLTCLIIHYPSHDQSRNFFAMVYADNIFHTLPEHSLLLATDDTAAGPLRYGQTVQKTRRDVLIIDTRKIILDPYCRRLIREAPEIVSENFLSIPPRERIPRLIDAHISRMPIYTTSPISDSYEAIPYGLVYKIVPKDMRLDLEGIKRANAALWKGYRKRGFLNPGRDKNTAAKSFLEKYAQSQSALGIFYDTHQQIQDAREAYEESLQYNPENFLSLYHFGKLLLSSGDIKKGEALLKKAKDVDPSLYLKDIPIGGNPANKEAFKAEAYIQSGNNLAGQGYFKDAIEEFKVALQWTPDNPQIYVQLGHIYLNTNDMDMAINMYRKAIEIDPGAVSLLAYLNLGGIYKNAHDIPNAIAHFEKFLELSEETELTDEVLNQIQHAKTQVKAILSNLKTTANSEKGGNPADEKITP